MKKLILSMVIAGSCLVAVAQMPDTSRQQQWNNSNPPDTSMQPQWNNDNRTDSMSQQPQWNNGNRADTVNQQTQWNNSNRTGTMEQQQQWNNGNSADSMRLQNLNNGNSFDSSKMNQQSMPMETTPAATGTPGSANLAPSQPVSTDVRNNDPMADTVNMRSATEQGTTGNNTSVNPAATFTTGDSTSGSNQAIPVDGTMSTNQSASTGNMPRGVNIPEASTLLTGLGKWSALPILNTFVPEDVVNKLKTAHGEKLYDITMLKTGENQYSYSARVQESGVYSTVIVQGDTTTVNQ